MKLSLTTTQNKVPGAPVLVQGPAADAFDLAHQLGYDGVEVHVRRPSEIDRDKLKKLADQYDLGIPTIGTGMAATQEGLAFPDPDPDIRRRTVERIKEQIALARHLKSAVTIGSVNGLLGADAQQRPIRREAALSCLQECTKIAADAGVTLLLEPLNRYECDYLNRLEEAMGVIGQIGMSNLKLLADTFHMNIEEVDIPASLRRAASALGHIHLADSNRQPPGYGHLDVREVLQALRDIDYHGYLSFEVLPLPNVRQATEDAIQTVKQIMSGLSSPHSSG